MLIFKLTEDLLRGPFAADRRFELLPGPRNNAESPADGRFVKLRHPGNLCLLMHSFHQDKILLSLLLAKLRAAIHQCFSWRQAGLHLQIKITDAI